jgi:cell division protein FtsX
MISIILGILIIILGLYWWYWTFSEEYTPEMAWYFRIKGFGAGVFIILLGILVLIEYIDFPWS